MVKKTLPETNVSIAYIDAKLVKSSERWYFEFWQGSIEKLVRYRPTFDINRIKSKKERKNTADEIVERLNEMLSQSLPAPVLIAEIKKYSEKGRVKFAADPHPLFHTPLNIAFNSIIEIKCQTDKKNSKKSYRHIAVLFNQFIETHGIASSPVSAMFKRDAIAFMDTLTLKGDCNNTWNNRLRDIRTVWSELKRREYTEKNPFEDIRYKRKSPKLRRNLTEGERVAISKYCAQNDVWLFRAIVLTYYELIRPSELARLRFGDFDFKTGTIRMSGDITKNGKPSVVTMNAVAMAYLLEGGDFAKYPTNYFVFGSCFVPNATKPVSENYLNYRHVEVMRLLRESGELGDTTGLSYYSWKDNGITDMANDKDVSIFKASQHARHSEPRTTLVYYHQSAIIPEIRQWKQRLF